MRRLLHLSSLWRSVVPWHPATAWALFASWLVFAGAWHGHGFEAGVRGGIAAFLAWAITRELAPKRFLASLLAPVAGLLHAIPAETVLVAGVGTLLVARIAARTVGEAPTMLDRAVLVAGTAWLATLPVGLPVALVLAAVTFSDERRLRARATGLVLLAVALGVGSVEGTLTLRPEWHLPPQQGQLLLAATALAGGWLLVARLPKRLRVRDDRDRGQLRGARLRSARFATVACVAAAVAWNGTDGAFALAPASGALLAAGMGGARLRGAPEAAVGSAAVPALG